MLCLEVEADAFLRHMVRTLVGTMIDVGRGEPSLEDFRRLLDGAPRDAGGLTAPPHGLFLWDIKYGRGGWKRPARAGGEASPFGGPYGTIPEDVAGDGGSRQTEHTADSEA
jgi:tRNA U38,U39,U40 pseudouridine synthase TruA